MIRARASSGRLEFRGLHVLCCGGVRWDAAAFHRRGFPPDGYRAGLRGVFEGERLPEDLRTRRES